MRFTLLLVPCALVLAPSAVSAQPQQRVAPPSRPVVSPYLNLLRSDNSPGVNYYGLVKPQMEFRRDIQNLRQLATSNQAAIADVTGTNGPVMPVTGHAAAFLNTGGYYPNRLGGTTSSPSASQGASQGQAATRPKGPTTRH